MDWMHAGFYAILPFLAAACGVILGGWGSDFLLKRTGSLNLARKLPLIAGLFGASSIMLASYVNGDALVIAILSTAFFSVPSIVLKISTALFKFLVSPAGLPSWIPKSVFLVVASVSTSCTILFISATAARASSSATSSFKSSFALAVASRISDSRVLGVGGSWPSSPPLLLSSR